MRQVLLDSQVLSVVWIASLTARQALNKYKDLEPGDEEIEMVDQLLKAMDTGRPAI